MNNENLFLVEKYQIDFQNINEHIVVVFGLTMFIDFIISGNRTRIFRDILATVGFIIYMALSYIYFVYGGTNVLASLIFGASLTFFAAIIHAYISLYCKLNAINIVCDKTCPSTCNVKQCDRGNIAVIESSIV